MIIHAVDDKAGVLRSLEILLRSHGFKVVASRSAEAFKESFDPEEPCCVLLDIKMPGMSGLDLLDWLIAQGHRVPVIMLSGHGDIRAAVRAMKNGAIDFLEKPVDADILLGALDEAKAFNANRPRRSVPPDVVAERLQRLTVREREILDHLVVGRTNKEIAVTLSISQRTVEIHRARIREKMEASRLSDLIMMVG